jgi:hypothetical protein
LDALERAPFAVGLRLPEVFGEELQVQTERAQMVLDLVNKAARQLD